MTEELNYNFAFESTKESFMENGLEYYVMPGLHELFLSSKKDFAKMILQSKKDRGKYQFILTLKEIE